MIQNATPVSLVMLRLPGLQWQGLWRVRLPQMTTVVVTPQVLLTWSACYVPLTVRVLHAPPVLTAPISDARYDPAVSAHGDVPKGSMLAELVRAAGEELRGVRVLGPCGTVRVW